MFYIKNMMQIYLPFCLSICYFHIHPKYLGASLLALLPMPSQAFNVLCALWMSYVDFQVVFVFIYFSHDVLRIS